MYTTENSTQYPVINCIGEESEKEWYMHMYSICTILLCT